MKKCYLDSNILIYFKNEDSPYYPLSTKFMAGWVEENTSFFVSPLVLDEVLHSLLFELRRKNVSNEFRQLRQALSEILSLPNIHVINPPDDIESQLRVVDLMDKYSLRPRDAYHLLIMMSNSIDSCATFDNDFKKVFAAKVISKA